MSKQFPTNFCWGASTSAHQIEGGLENNWSRWEPKNAKEKSKRYKENSPTWYEMKDENYRDACNPSNYISGKACDSYNRYKEDVLLLKHLGLNAYRFSVDWSRVEPEKGEFSKEGIQYYINLVKELRASGIEPFLTCWHWPIPLWLEEEGGLHSKDIVEYFRRYISFLVENLGESVKYWISINEPLVVTSESYHIGNWPPQKKTVFLSYRIAFKTLVNMHREAYLVIKGYDEGLKVGVAKNNGYFEAYSSNPINKLIARVSRYYSNFKYLDMVKGSLDFIGLNYYFHNRVGISGLRNDNDRVSDLGWWMKPRSIFYPLKELKDRYDLPVYVTENGVADRDGEYREWWLDESVEAMQEALEYGVDLRGYMHWSLLDNFEWADGYWPRFGLATSDRKIKESGWYYRDLIDKYR